MNKSSLRTEYLEKRSSLGFWEIEEKNNGILENTKLFVEENNFIFIHIFLPQQGSNEINTWKLIHFFRSTHPYLKIVVPRVIPGTKHMEHYLFTSETKLIDNRWKIPEPDPATSKIIDPQQLDVVFIPLLSFDKKGYRVGYGGGFYDRFLPKCKPDILKVGLSFFDPVNKITDTDPYDIPLNACIMSSGIVKFIQ